MSANSFGRFFRVSTFGESHGVGLGAVVDGCPAGVNFSLDFVQRELVRRRPGSQAGVSQRQELDQVEVISGVFEGKTLGTPIMMLVRNQDAKSEDYAAIKASPRAGHADDVWRAKFGHSDHRGGGRSSGRETLARVLGGAVAKMLLQQLSPPTQIIGYSEQLGPLQADAAVVSGLSGWAAADAYSLRFPAGDHARAIELMLNAQKAGESYGGIVGVRIDRPPANLGAPVFHKLKADFASAMMGIGATIGFELGAGFAAVEQAGTQFHAQAASAVYGGIRGGISTGEPIAMRIAFKPTSSILDVAKKGRHDPCIVPRAVPVCEAMAALVLVDHLLAARLDRA